MTSRNRFDCVIIGGGHNGLVAAAYLAKAGKTVCVLERRHVLGGAATTEELWPGYKVSTAAYVVSLLLPEIIRELRLAYYGLVILPRSPSSFTPLEDGRSLLMGTEPGLNVSQIAQFNQRDAAAYPRYEGLLERVAETLEPLLSQSAPDPLPLPASWRRIGLAKRGRDAAALWRMYRAMGQLGDELPEALELLAGSARTILDRWFESDVLKATLATDAIIGAFASISSPGSAYVLLHHVMGQATGVRGVWGYVQGGMGALSESIARSAVDLGVEIRREAEVVRILTSKGRAAGVALADGSQIESWAVASSVDPHWTFERLLEPDALPEQFRAAVARIDYSSASAKINLALAEPPRFTCLPGEGIGPHHRGTIHVGPSLDYLERAFDDAKYGRPSQRPILEITLPTSVDTSIAPPGRHLMSMFVQYAPYRLADGDWDQVKEAFADRCIDELARYAPNVPAAVLHRQVLSPLDLERTFRLTGGNIFQGAMSLGQLFSLRPVAGWADHRTPLPGLYLCGAASHPGGGVMGACGRNAAREILRDF
ncbi:MAG: NAD(P)/FAD-dependent oxidoreductase [Pirellulales bacterium]